MGIPGPRALGPKNKYGNFAKQAKSLAEPFTLSTAPLGRKTLPKHLQMPSKEPLIAFL